MLPLISTNEHLPALLGAPGGLVLAYLDPGSGSLLLQLLLAGLLSGAFFLKSSLGNVRASIGRLFKSRG